MKKNSILLLLTFVSFLIILGSFNALAEERLTLWCGYPELAPFLEMVAKDFVETHPNSKVEILAYPLQDFYQKLVVSLPTSTAADIIICDNVVVRNYIEGGFCLPNPPKIDDLLKSGAYPKSDIEQATFGDDTYSIPFMQSIIVMFWNKTMFAEEGLNNAPRDWTEVIDYSKKLARYDQAGNLIRSGISLRLSGGSTGPADKWWPWLYIAGGNILEKYPNGKYRAGYDNEAGREALQLHIDLLYKDKVDDPKLKHDAEGFALEQTAMFLRESWVVEYMREYAPHVEYDTAPMPSYKRAGGFSGVITANVTGSSKNPDLAWDFVHFLVAPENQKNLFMTTGWTPSRRDVDYTDLYEKIPQYRSFLEVPENYEFYDYEPIASVDQIQVRLSERLVNAFIDESLIDNPEGITRIIHEAAEETNNILKENDLYYE